MPYTVFIDDFLPVYMARAERVDFKDPLDSNGKPYVPNVEDRNHKGVYIGSKVKAPVFGRIARDGSLWGPILEKALAKVYGNYIHLEGGELFESTILTGFPSLKVQHSRKSLSEIRELLLVHAPANKNDLVTTATYPETNINEFNEIGIHYNHAYTVLDIFEVTYRKNFYNLKSVTTTLIKIRNGNRAG